MNLPLGLFDYLLEVKMKKIIATLLVFSVIVSLPLTTAFAYETRSVEEDTILSQAQSYLTAAAENMWLYESNNLEQGTISQAVTTYGRAAVTDELPVSEVELEEYTEGISFVENKTEYFKALRQSQDIQRENFNAEYEAIDVNVDGQKANVRILEYISFNYPDFPDVLSEAVNDYSVELVKINGDWVVADVTALNDWFDDSFKEIGFDANNPNKSFDWLEAQAAKEVQQIESEEHSTPPESVPSAVAASSVLYAYNGRNAAAYAYTYATSKYNDIENQSDSQKKDGRTYWNQNFAQYGPDTDCMNFASQSLYTGFGGNNTQSSIANHNAPMDTTGSFTWYGTTRGNEYSDDVSSWRSCSYFRTYLANEKSTSLPDIYVDQYTLTGSTNFKDIPNYSTKLVGAIVHVNSGGHAIVITDVGGYERKQVLFTAHTSDRKGVAVGEYWNSSTIYVMIPQSIRVYNPPSVRITPTLQRPVPVNSTISLYSGTNISCSSIQVTVTSPTGASSTKSTTNTTSNSYSYKFTERGLYTVTTTAKQTSTSTAQTYVYTVRVY